MQNTSSAVTADKTGKTAGGKVPDKAGEKAGEKVAEKRRALGRGLESLLPGPRAVSGAVPATFSQNKDPQTSSPQSGAPVMSSVVPEPEDSHSQEERVGVLRLRTDIGGADAGTSLRMTSREESEHKPLSGTAAPVVPVGGIELSAEAAPAADGEEVLRLRIDLIDENPYQTRRVFNENALQELADSIRAQGVLQPVVVRLEEGGRYALILGERRLRASKLAGFDTIPAVVRRVSRQRAAEMTLVENLQRQDLNCVEQAEAFANLSQKFKLTQEQIGAQVGVSRQTVANYMRILILSEGIIGMLQKGKLSYSHARVLLMLSDPDSRWKLAQRAVEENLSVAQLEDLVQGLFVPHGHEKAQKPGGARWMDPNVKAAQRSLEEVLGMRVRIRDRNGRGKILIEYGTIDDFERVVKMLRGN
jgi:ParB family chromosome partitioning protein